MSSTTRAKIFYGIEGVRSVALVRIHLDDGCIGYVTQTVGRTTSMCTIRLALTTVCGRCCQEKIYLDSISFLSQERPKASFRCFPNVLTYQHDMRIATATATKN